jgi:hypothetical protein
MKRHKTGQVQCRRGNYLLSSQTHRAQLKVGLSKGTGTENSREPTILICRKQDEKKMDPVTRLRTYLLFHKSVLDHTLFR